MNLRSVLKSPQRTTWALAVCLIAFTPLWAPAKTVSGHFLTATNGEEKPAKKSKTKNKSFTALNNTAVKIYPDALKREMHVVAKDNDGKEIDFFVFDLEGTMLHNYKMQSREHKKLSGMKRGTYIYRVFNGDEETAAGKFEIR